MKENIATTKKEKPPSKTSRKKRKVGLIIFLGLLFVIMIVQFFRNINHVPQKKFCSAIGGIYISSNVECYVSLKTFRGFQDSIGGYGLGNRWAHMLFYVTESGSVSDHKSCLVDFAEPNFGACLDSLGK